METIEKEPKTQNLKPLSHLKSGDEGIVKSFNGGIGLIKKFINIGIHYGSRVKVVNAAGGPIIISFGSTKAAIGKGAASKIIVEIVK
ncbi:MAG: ferrous iron transport protein A [Deltaproteobacteria bacterium]|nr:ferrous iron transport protein A [Deltaproteobacteria bacterium]MCL5791623.1 ferrous iron transport protein A [Deltaproteobacteria bacterium]